MCRAAPERSPKRAAALLKGQRAMFRTTRVFHTLMADMAASLQPLTLMTTLDRLSAAKAGLPVSTCGHTLASNGHENSKR